MARARRTVEATAFVAVWIAIGYAIPKDPNLYLVIGIPLTVAFQLVVRRRPIEDAWVRGGHPCLSGPNEQPSSSQHSSPSLR